MAGLATAAQVAVGASAEEAAVPRVCLGSAEARGVPSLTVGPMGSLPAGGPIVSEASLIEDLSEMGRDPLGKRLSAELA